MLTPIQIERLTKLGTEQLAIAEKWDKEREEQSKLIDMLGEAEKVGNHELFRTVLDKIGAMTPSMCEHDRSIWSNCASCDKIEQAIHPELFCAQCSTPFSMFENGTEETSHKVGDICPDCEFENKHD